MATWLLVCLILSESYAGNLRAFLTTPTHGKGINTWADILDSGLPWDMVIYGTDIEVLMATTDDPVLSKIWNGMDKLGYSDSTTNERVNFVLPDASQSICQVVNLLEFHLSSCPMCWTSNWWPLTGWRLFKSAPTLTSPPQVVNHFWISQRI